MSDSNAVDTRGDDAPKRASLATFLRQVIAELRKVVWPTQKELITYFLVVLFFVIVMMLIVSGLDLAFGKLAFWMFT